MKAVSCSPKRMGKDDYQEFCEKFCKNEPCEYVKSVPKEYINGGGESRGWNKGNYAERIAKAKYVYYYDHIRSEIDKTTYVNWWETETRYYLEIDNIDKLYDIIKYLGRRVILYKITEEEDNYGPLFGRPYLNDASVLEIYDGYIE